MTPLSPSHPPPTFDRSRANASLALWTGIGALAATVLLGLAAPRFAGHASAGPPHEAGPAATAAPVVGQMAPSTSADASLPRAVDVFTGRRDDIAAVPQPTPF